MVNHPIIIHLRNWASTMILTRYLSLSLRFFLQITNISRQILTCYRSVLIGLWLLTTIINIIIPTILLSLIKGFQLLTARNFRLTLTSHILILTITLISQPPLLHKYSPDTCHPQVFTCIKLPEFLFRYLHINYRLSPFSTKTIMIKNITIH